MSDDPIVFNFRDADGKPVAGHVTVTHPDGTTSGHPASRLTLPEFLLVRIAEDEAIEGTYRPDGPGLLEEMSYDIGGVVTISDRRLMAECEAKRRIVELHLEHESFVKAYRSPRWLDAMNDEDRVNAKKAEARCAVSERIVRLLALPYADHPDYDEAWKPS